MTDQSNKIETDGAGTELQTPWLEVLQSKSIGDPSICIAVLDGPVDLSHPCFEGANLTLLETLVPGEADGGPASKHGTHVASVIFGQPGSPVTGIAPACRGLIVPVFAGGPDKPLIPCSQIDLARAIALSLQHGASIINISGGQIEPSGQAHPLLAEAVRLCARQNVLIVAAAGNDGCECLHIPAALDAVLAVGAMDWKGTPLSLSNWGAAYQANGILAPGENIKGATPAGGIATGSGTSFAAPIVAGIAGLLTSLQLEMGGRADMPAVRRALIETAIDCEQQPASDCRRLLSGRVNVAGALEQITQGGIEMSEHGTIQESGCTVIAGGVPAARPAGRTVGGGMALGTTPGPITEAVVPQGAEGGCGCKAQSEYVDRNLVYVLGQIGYDFGTQARRDYFVQKGLTEPYNPAQLLIYLESNPTDASELIWTLSQETIQIYALRPIGPFASQAYSLIEAFLNGQLTDGVERVSIPGYVAGQVMLSSGQAVPIIDPQQGGMYEWSTASLILSVLGPPPTKEPELAIYNKKAAGITNFLNRVYYELRNLGMAPQDRAMNYAATNAFQVGEIFQSAVKEGLQLDSIRVERSSICRPESDCWDVLLTFFNPMKRLEEAKKVYSFTVDVSDVFPVTIGTVQSWFAY